MLVRQSEVSKGFKMPVPIRVKFADGDVKQYVLNIDEEEKTFHLTLPGKPKDIVLNPDCSVLARVKKK